MLVHKAPLLRPVLKRLSSSGHCLIALQIFGRDAFLQSPGQQQRALAANSHAGMRVALCRDSCGAVPTSVPGMMRSGQDRRGHPACRCFAQNGAALVSRIRKAVKVLDSPGIRSASSRIKALTALIHPSNLNPIKTWFEPPKT